MQCLAGIGSVADESFAQAEHRSQHHNGCQQDPGPAAGTFPEFPSVIIGCRFWYFSRSQGTTFISTTPRVMNRTTRVEIALMEGFTRLLMVYTMMDRF